MMTLQCIHQSSLFALLFSLRESQINSSFHWRNNICQLASCIFEEWRQSWISSICIFCSHCVLYVILEIQLFQFIILKVKTMKLLIFSFLQGRGSHAPIDIWQSKFSNFYYGCSERGPHFARKFAHLFQLSFSRQWTDSQS